LIGILDELEEVFGRVDGNGWVGGLEFGYYKDVIPPGLLDSCVDSIDGGVGGIVDSG
jgi:hypothetical protein